MDSISNEVTVRWLSESSQAGTVVIDGRSYTSTPVQATALDYQSAEPTADRYRGLPYLRRVAPPQSAVYDGTRVGHRRLTGVWQ